MALIRYVYLVFLNSNKYLIYDVNFDHQERTNAIKDLAIAAWSNATETFTRSQLTVRGPLRDNPTDRISRGVHRNAGNYTKIDGSGNLASVTLAEWKTAFQTNHPEFFRL